MNAIGRCFAFGLILMVVTTVRPAAPVAVQLSYLKEPTPLGGRYFGERIAIDGQTLVVGIPDDGAEASGVNPVVNPNLNAQDSGAIQVFIGSGSSWSHEAYIKASNSKGSDRFGQSVAISGNTIVVGAPEQDGDGVGANAAETITGRNGSGAAYVFVRDDTNWVQQAYLKASNPFVDDNFGTTVSISGDTLVVAAANEDGGSAGVNGDESNDDIGESGAVSVFVREGTNWSQQAYLKPPHPTRDEQFGHSLAIDGQVIVVGVPQEDGADPNDSSQDGESNAGAAFVFERSGSTWGQTAYLKASNLHRSDEFGTSVAVSQGTIVVGASFEDGIVSRSGAAYVFVKSGQNWIQQDYLKAEFPGDRDGFAASVAISGEAILIGARKESSAAGGIDGNANDDSVNDTGAAYLFARSGTSWTQRAYLKASNPAEDDFFGASVSLSGIRAVVGAPYQDDTAGNSGAAYVFSVSRFIPPEIVLQPQPQAVVISNTITLSVSAPESGVLIHQWFRNGIPLTNNVRVTGARGHQLTIVDAAPSDAGIYTVAVSNDFGGVISSPAQVLVDHAPFFVARPNGQIASPNSSASFIATVIASPTAALRWQRSTNSGLTWSDLSDGNGFFGALSDSLTVSPTAQSFNGDLFRLTATNLLGGTMSQAASLSVVGSVTNLPGRLDHTFGRLGTQAVTFGEGVASAAAIATQPDGKILVAGAASLGSSGAFALTRFTATGALDTEFGDGGKVRIPLRSSSDIVRSMALQADGKIVLGGYSSDGLRGDFAIVRCHPDGSLDDSFGNGGVFILDLGAADICTAVQIQPDGKIVAAGYRNFSSSMGSLAMLRLLPDGTLDPGFGDQGKVISSPPAFIHAKALSLLPDGKILVAGDRNVVHQAMLIHRYHADGTLDESFGQMGEVLLNLPNGSRCVEDMAVLPDGKILLAGDSQAAGESARVTVVRFHADGSLDATFANRGLAVMTLFFPGSARAMTIADDGGILLAATIYQNADADIAAIRLTIDGHLDNNFGNGGVWIGQLTDDRDSSSAIATQADGAVLLAGQSPVITDFNSVLLRLAAPPPGVSVSRETNGDVLLQFSRGAPGWRIQQRSHLNSGSWSELSNLQTNGATWRVLKSQLMGGTARFFRTVRD